MNEAVELTVDAAAAGERLDKYLVQQLTHVSRSQLQRWIKEGCVVVNDICVAPKYHVRIGDEVVVTPPDATPSHVLPQHIPLTIVYEDSDLLVVNKSADMVVHPGAGNPDGTLVNALLAHTTDLSGIGGVLRPGIVHRLDRGTSGLIIVAKHDRAHTGLAEQFANRSVQKTYVALCYGNMLATGRIDSPIGRHPTDRKRMSVHSRQSKAALTTWQMREPFAPHLSWIEVNIATGRTHQIRVHLASVGHALVGDATYGGPKMVHRLPARWQSAVQSLSHPALHAWRLRVQHPCTGATLTWEAPLPDDIEQLLQTLRNLPTT